MTTRYPGGLIRKTPPTITPPVDGEGGSAPGVWTLEQASYYIKTGTWPLPTILKYLYVVGGNQEGQLGQNNTIARSSPVQVGSDNNWSSIAAGAYSMIAAKSNGTLWTWGVGTSGVLGLNDAIKRSSPVQVGALTNWRLVASSYYSCAAIKTDGTLWTWGQNGFGQLGLGDASNRSSPVQVGTATNWSYVSVGIFAMIGVTTTGALYTWGSGQGDNSILGQNNDIQRSSPTQVGALTTWLNATIGQYSSMATKTDGTIWGWGRNTSGQVGDNTTINRSSPVQVGALTDWTLAKTNGYLHSMGRRSYGTLWLWGRNNYGQLGQNNTIDRSSPVQLGADTNWSSQVMPLYAHGNVAIKTNGTLWVWGLNQQGRLGVNNTTEYSSPVQVGTDTTWLQVVSSGIPAYSIIYLKS